MILIMKNESRVLVLSFVLAGIVTSQRAGRPIPVEHSCNRLPYIIKDTELQFSYNAEYLTDRSCAITITTHAHDQLCLNFVQYYLDCDTDIIVFDSARPLQKRIYKCDSEHSEDFCSSKTTLEIIFQRMSHKKVDSFGHVELRIYSIAITDSIPTSTVTVFIVIGGVFGVILLLVVASFILSRFLYYCHYNNPFKHVQQHEELPLHEDVPLEPPPPYPGPDSEQQEMSTY